MSPTAINAVASRPRDGMHPEVLAQCAQALCVDAAVVQELRDSADLLPALMARSILDARARSTRDQPDEVLAARAARFCRAVFEGWGEAVFTVGDLLGWCEGSSIELRREVLAACRALCECKGADENPSKKALGMRLARVTPDHLQASEYRLVRVNTTGGTANWRVELDQLD